MQQIGKGAACYAVLSEDFHRFHIYCKEIKVVVVLRLARMKCIDRSCCVVGFRLKIVG